MALEIQAFLTGLYGFYNTIFHPILALGPYQALIIFSAILAATFSIIYRLLLDIDAADKLKAKIKDKQEAMKEARKNDKSEEASEHMQETMQLNQKLMMLNLKPMIVTMLFVSLIFPWLSVTFSPNVPLEYENGIYTGELEYASQTTPITVENNSEIIMTIEDQEIREGDTVEAHGVEWEFNRFTENNGGMFSIHQGTIVNMRAEFINLPFSLPFAGNALNWLGFYIILAMPLTFTFRKILGVN